MIGNFPLSVSILLNPFWVAPSKFNYFFSKEMEKKLTQRMGHSEVILFLVET